MAGACERGGKVLCFGANAGSIITENRALNFENILPFKNPKEKDVFGWYMLSIVDGVLR